MDAREYHELLQLKAALPDDLRDKGWAVAVHNDYRQDGARRTFWLFTKGDRCVKGEGNTDREALDEVRRQVNLMDPDFVRRVTSAGGGEGP